MTLFKSALALTMGATLCASLSVNTMAATKYHRLVWDSNPSTNAVIGFSPDGTSNSPYVSYGYSTNENQWSTQGVTRSDNFSSLTSHFVRLSNLNANSDVFYRVCDQDGCGDRFWFKTAPTSASSSFVVVAGGDTRTGWTNRRQGNQLLAKIRPLFVMHGGDFTNANNVSEMTQFLQDWTLTYSSDSIDGISYKRIYPLVPTHGNHEDNNYKTLCEVFGVDFNGDGQCTSSDTYGAFNVSPLLRVYTLNSQYKNSGWSSYANTMNNWLSNDLNQQGSSATWRVAQYHKPMFPHYTGKSENTILFNWWASDFYDYAMNLVVESDTHINKLTKAIVPTGSGFSSTTNGGTVYVGEGSWGAPARSANDPKSWTIDLASIQQFKVLTITPSSLEVRTAQFNGSPSTLTRSQRQNNSTVLPSNVNWWSANGYGDVVELVQGTGNRSIINTSSSSGGSSSGSGSSITFNATADAFIASNRSTSNYGNNNSGLLADGADNYYGVINSVVAWDVNSVPSCTTVNSASITIDVTDVSSGSYSIYAANSGWGESSITWQSVSGSALQGTAIASFTPSSTGSRTIALNAQGIGLIENWLQGNNYGVVVSSNGTTNGLDFSSREQGNGPVLTLVTSDSNCGSTSSDSMDFTSTADTFIASNRSTNNYNNSSEGILADGADSYYGVMNALVDWDVSNIPTCAIVDSAELTINVTNVSPGSYSIYAANNGWNESSATWQSVGGTSLQGSALASFTPSSTGLKTVAFNSQGVNTVQNWLQGNSNGVVIASGGTSNGLDFSSREQNNGAKLSVTYTLPSGCQ